MLHILAATDFSAVADNAVQYACSLAKENNGSLTIVHSFIIPVTFSDTPMPVIPVDEGRKIAEERMNRHVAQLKTSYPGLNVGSKILFGDLVDSLVDYLEDAKADLIVLGNSGTGDSWLGSNVLTAVRNLPRIVIAIPAQSQYGKIEKVCFACDLKNVEDHLPVADFKKLIGFTNAQLHILNVDYHNKEFKPDTSFENTELHTSLSDLKPVYHYVENENLEEGIQQFLEANKMDWLIVLPHKHSFFEGLFHKSRTKAILRIAQLPLVALHEK